MTLPLHYGEVEKKTAESGQLWEFISPQFFLQKIRIILLNAVLTPKRISENFIFEKTEEERDKKGKKHVAHVC